MKHRLALIAALMISTFAGAEPPAGSWIDVSAPIDPKTTPVYPGNTPVKLEFNLNYDKGDKLALSSYTLGAHTGTHVDAPMHFVKVGASANQKTKSSAPAKVESLRAAIWARFCF